ncbi:MAG: BlaI/MecI/CopY family transcriptional regulator [Sphingobacteriales bacterium]|nr:MAG: BlaI/MecI/CopY family transcriptional regulator [Sphingobacteriales bacterium]
MKALWQYEAAFVRDIISAMPAPKPHANTVNTILKILAEKGIVEIEPMGNANRFRALVSKEDYRARTTLQVVKNYFDGSFIDMVSFFVANKNLDIAELESILKAVKKKKE